MSSHIFPRRIKQPSDIIDNYTEYLDDSLGYGWDIWQIVGTDIRKRHDAILQFGSDYYNQHIVEKTSDAPIPHLDLYILALAKYKMDQGEEAEAIKLYLSIIDSQNRQPYLRYIEIFEKMLRLYLQRMTADKSDIEAHAPLLTLFHRDVEESWRTTQDYYCSLLKFYQEKEQEEDPTEETFVEKNLVGRTIERQFEVIEDIAFLIHEYQSALDLITGLEEFVRTTFPDHPLNADIVIFRSRLLQVMGLEVP